MLAFCSRNSQIIYRKECLHRRMPGYLQVCFMQPICISEQLNGHLERFWHFDFIQYSSEHRDRTPKTNVSGFVTKPQLNEIDCDYIGPPDKLSNLRPILRHAPKDETPAEEALRLKQIEVEEWNRRFWQTHNKKFIEVRNFTLRSAWIYSFMRDSHLYRRRKHSYWRTRKPTVIRWQRIK